MNSGMTSAASSRFDGRSSACAALASERAALGAVINGDARLTDSGLTAGDFADDFNRAVFAACVQIERDGGVADLVTLADRFPTLDAQALAELTAEGAVQRSVIDQHVRNVRGAALRRALIEFGGRLCATAQDSEQAVEDVLNAAQADLAKLGAGAAAGTLTSCEDAKIALYTLLTTKDARPPIATGLAKLDGALRGGLRGGKLVIVAARPAVGKSAMLGQIAVKAVEGGRRVLYASLEMGVEEVMARFVGNVASVPVARLDGYSEDGELFQAVCDGFALLPDKGLYFANNARTPSALRRAALYMRAHGGLDLIAVDYLQLLNPDGRTQSRWESVGCITRALKLLAMEMGTPVVVAAQVNRASVAGAKPEMPKLSELRESGSIEQDADVVLMLHAPDQQETPAWRALGIAKFRQGETGAMHLFFDGARMRLRDATAEEVRLWTGRS